MFSNPNKKHLTTLRDLGFPIGTGWWSKHPTRALEELYKMTQGSSAFAHAVGSKMVWEESIVTNFGTFFNLSIQTENYPHKAPKVFVTNRTIPRDAKAHVYNDGSLCLQHPSEYNSRTSVLQIRNRACAWCFAYEIFRASGEWPAAEYKH